MEIPQQGDVHKVWKTETRNGLLPAFELPSHGGHREGGTEGSNEPDTQGAHHGLLLLGD